MRDRLEQVAALARLRREQRRRARVAAAARLRRLTGGAPLASLPVLTKADLVERFDELVTDPALRRADLEAFVASAPPGARFRRRYRVAVSSGSAGTPGIVVFDPHEWAGLLAASAAARRIAGPPPGRRSAKVASPSPWHLSAQLGATLEDPRKPTLRLPVTMPVPELAAAIDGFAPDVLTAYPSVLGLLAGRLRSRPAQVYCAGEVLTGATRRRVAEAWGVEPFDQYATTEAGTIAAECPAHEGLHVLDDHVVLEVVDDRHRPVPPGTHGAAVLVTALSSRTIPLVRYELRDSVAAIEGPCPCGRPGPRITAPAGRARNLLHIGGEPVHPTALTAVLDTAPVAAWQVTVLGDGDRVRAVVAGAREPFDAAALGAALREAAGVPADVEVVDRIPPRPNGKAELFVTDPAF